MRFLDVVVQTKVRYLPIPEPHFFVCFDFFRNFANLKQGLITSH